MPLQNVTLFAIILFAMCIQVLAQDETQDVSDLELSGYNLVYLVTDDSDISSSPHYADVLQTFGVQEINSMREVETYESALQIDAVFIHPSALDFVDTEWLQQAYANGVVIVAFNIPPEQFAHLVGNPTLADRYTLIENEVVYVVVSQYDWNGQWGNQRQVGLLADELEYPALVESLPIRLMQMREQKRDYLRSRLSVPEMASPLH